MEHAIDVYGGYPLSQRQAAVEVVNDQGLRSAVDAGTVALLMAERGRCFMPADGSIATTCTALYRAWRGGEIARYTDADGRLMYAALDARPIYEWASPSDAAERAAAIAYTIRRNRA